MLLGILSIASIYGVLGNFSAGSARIYFTYLFIFPETSSTIHSSIYLILENVWSGAPGWLCIIYIYILIQISFLICVGLLITISGYKYIYILYVSTWFHASVFSMIYHILVSWRGGCAHSRSLAHSRVQAGPLRGSGNALEPQPKSQSKGRWPPSLCMQMLRNVVPPDSIKMHQTERRSGANAKKHAAKARSEINRTTDWGKWASMASIAVDFHEH